MITQGVELGALWASYAKEYGIFIGMIFGALTLGATPLGRPLKWAETFYHEFSHGMAALLTFGRPVKLELKWNGAGTCWTRGGNRIVILLAGYMGSAVWGTVLYLIGWGLAHKGGGIEAVVWLRVELAIMAVATLLLVRNLTTFLIMGIIMGVYGAALYFPMGSVLPWVLQFMGIYVVLNAIRAPLHLIDGKHVGDGAALADIFVIIPEIVWVLWWFLFALAALGLCAYLTLPGIEPLVNGWLGL